MVFATYQHAAISITGLRAVCGHLRCHLQIDFEQSSLPWSFFRPIVLESFEGRLWSPVLGCVLKITPSIGPYLAMVHSRSASSAWLTPQPALLRSLEPVGAQWRDSLLRNWSSGRTGQLSRIVPHLPTQQRPVMCRTDQRSFTTSIACSGELN